MDCPLNLSQSCILELQTQIFTDSRSKKLVDVKLDELVMLVVKSSRLIHIPGDVGFRIWQKSTETCVEALSY